MKDLRKDYIAQRQAIKSSGLTKTQVKLDVKSLKKTHPYKLQKKTTFKRYWLRSLLAVAVCVVIPTVAVKVVTTLNQIKSNSNTTEGGANES